MKTVPPSFPPSNYFILLLLFYFTSISIHSLSFQTNFDYEDFDSLFRQFLCKKNIFAPSCLQDTQIGLIWGSAEKFSKKKKKKCLVLWLNA